MTDETERLTQRFEEAEETHRLEEVGETHRLEEAEETHRLEEVGETHRLDTADNPDLVETYVRFGPGIPAPAAPAPDRATAIWRGEVRPVAVGETARQSPERRSQRWIMPLTVLILVIAVLIYFLWGRGTNPVTVESVAVAASTPTVACEGTERLNAVITTNGGSGTITYQWQRSDGTHSDVLTQNVSKGESKVSVALLWNFDGYGTLDATANLRVVSPGDASGSATFRYICAKQ